MALQIKVQDEQLKTIQRLSAHEQAMGDLYRAYAERFPEAAELFRDLASAERAHAKWIADFATRMKAGQLQINPRRFRPAAFDTSLTHIREQIGEAQTGEVTLLTALSVSHDLEEALLERRYFEVLEGDSPELAELLLHLERETAEHLVRVRGAWEAERGR
jgi:rubrerythrin